MMLPGGVASAGTAKPKPPPVEVTCTTLSGTEASASFSGCTPTSAVGSAGTGATTIDTLSLPNITATVTWGNGTTTDFAAKLKIIPFNTIAKKNKDVCPAVVGDTEADEVVEKGKVTAGGTGTLTVKGKVVSTECVYNVPASGGNPATTMVDLLSPATF